MNNSLQLNPLASEILDFIKQLAYIEFANFEIKSENDTFSIHFHIQAKQGSPVDAFKNNIDTTFAFCFANEKFVKHNLDKIINYTIHTDKDFYYFKSLKSSIALSRTTTCSKCSKVHYHLSVIYCDNPKKDCPEK